MFDFEKLIDNAFRETELINSFWENSSVLNCIVDTKGYFMYVNDAWVNLLGWTREELTTQPFLDLVHPTDAKRTMDVYERKINNSSHYFINRFRKKNGDYIAIEWIDSTQSKDKQCWLSTARPLNLDLDSGHGLLQYIFRDDNVVKSFFYNSPTCNALFDHDGTYLAINNVLANALGYPPEEVIGKNFTEHIHPDDLQDALSLATNLALGLDINERAQSRYKTKEGKYITVEKIDTLMVNNGNNVITMSRIIGEG